MTFAEKSKELRATYMVTQLDLAKATNLSRSCISMIEIGKNEPTATTLIAYAKYFDVTVDYLLGLEDEELKPSISYTPTAPALTEKERDLLDTFRTMPEPLQSIALNTVHSLAGTESGSIALNKRA